METLTEVETLVRTYHNGEEYAADAARLAKEGWHPAFEPTREGHWRLGLHGKSAATTTAGAIASGGLSLLVPTKKEQLTVTYQRTAPKAPEAPPEDAVEASSASGPAASLPAAEPAAETPPVTATMRAQSAVAMPQRAPQVRIETDVTKYWGWFHKKQYEAAAESRAKDGWRVVSVVPIKTWGNDGLMVTFQREVVE